ncbi:putative chromo domain-containing protein [Colletotrichum sojae]|uniref:Putative chromo domain-containing protein n=1 Tax=Colletotrichum sojae TaxID=2175907 RepID=A0A8H6IMS9_9PEZI|nr:putative chromo domain-containing protein [Colletotrichum sojae]
MYRGCWSRQMSLRLLERLAEVEVAWQATLKISAFGGFLLSPAKHSALQSPNKQERFNTVLVAEESPSDASRSPLPFQRLSSQLALSWPTRRKTLNDTAADKMGTTIDGITPADTVAASAAAHSSESTTMPLAYAAVVNSVTSDPEGKDTIAATEQVEAGQEFDRTNLAAEVKETSIHLGCLSEAAGLGNDIIQVATPAISGAEINVATATETGDTTKAAQPADNSEAAEDVDDPEHGIFVFGSLIGHRHDPDDQTLFQIRVCWTHDAPTWEPESNIQEDAEEALFAYWDAVEGGRIGAMADKNLWHALKVEKHKQEANGSVKLCVSWVGSPERSWEPEGQVLQYARQHVDDYWTANGGRPKHIKHTVVPVKRGRGLPRNTSFVEEAPEKP